MIRQLITVIALSLLASSAAGNTETRGKAPVRIFEVPAKAKIGSNHKSFGLPAEGAKVFNWQSRHGLVEVAITPKGGTRTIVTDRGTFIEQTNAKKRLVSESCHWGTMISTHFGRTFEGGKPVLSATRMGMDGTSFTVTRRSGQGDNVTEKRGKDYVGTSRSKDFWVQELTQLLDLASAKPQTELFKL